MERASVVLRGMVPAVARDVAGWEGTASCSTSTARDARRSRASRASGTVGCDGPAPAMVAPNAASVGPKGKRGSEVAGSLWSMARDAASLGGSRSSSPPPGHTTLPPISNMTPNGSSTRVSRAALQRAIPPRCWLAGLGPRERGAVGCGGVGAVPLGIRVVRLSDAGAAWAGREDARACSPILLATCCTISSSIRGMWAAPPASNT